MENGLLLELELVHESAVVWLIRGFSVNGVVSHVEARGISPEDAFAKALAQIALSLVAPELKK